ncbi:hypothetical protein CLOP_g9849 [Closterium sp. NIES-67]|nr:hypothetical protein CLOP_g9849 [Closterium sp. NIES-67]
MEAEGLCRTTCLSFSPLPSPLLSPLPKPLISNLTTSSIFLSVSQKSLGGSARPPRWERTSTCRSYGRRSSRT